MAPTYQYGPISASEIRLFRLISNAGDTISAHLQSFSIGEAPPYVALSYRWGVTERDRTISADGESLLITSSLEAFLCELGRRQDSGLAPTWFWIDAVCINQDDTTERNEQVRRMKEIYEGARSIVIWLGEGDSGTCDAMDTLEELAQLDCTEVSIRDGNLPGTTCKLGDEEAYIEVLHSTLTFDISTILQSEYWNRSWIVQEASTPVSHISTDMSDDGGTFVWCGAATMEWETLCEANRRLIDASWTNPVTEHAGLHGIANQDIATLSHVRGRRELDVYSESLYQMLVRSRTSTASDPRDKLYSVLGLAKDPPPDLQPDYSRTTEQVYTELAKELITSTSCLDYLGSAMFLEGHELPSFVPDWRLQYDCIPQPFYQLDRTHNSDDSIEQERNLFKADNSLISAINFTLDDTRLTARGFCFDVISKVSTPRIWPGYDQDSDELWQNWVALASPVDGTYVSGLSRFDALAKTLKADFEDAWGDWSSFRGSSIEGFTDPSLNVFELRDPIVDAMTYTRRLFETRQGYLGLGAFTVEQDDRVCILFGSQMPLVLRSVDGHWVFLGQAYVHGIMDGEALEDFEDSKGEDFEIW